MSQRQRDRLPTHSHASTALGLEPGGDESERAVLPAEKRKGGPARDKGGEWAAADASRGSAVPSYLCTAVSFWYRILCSPRALDQKERLRHYSLEVSRIL